MSAADSGRTPLQRLFSPRHMAVFGGQAAAEVIRQSRALGFDGDIWPVHPTRSEVAGHRCYASVDALPAAPDASFIAIPSAATVDVVRQLQGKGAGGAICYASGFAEVGTEGAALQRELVQAAGPMALIGPNCYGMLNYLDGVALWPDQHGGQRLQRGVAIVTQSGNIGLNLTMQRRGLPLAYLITVGNQAGDGLDRILHALLQDPRVSAIGLHIEGLDNVAAFSEAAIQAARRGVPLVALKAGSSELGARTTMSHTSSLAGPDRLYDAMFQRYGIARVQDVSTLLETLKLLHVLGPLPGRRITSASCSGGEASLLADLAQTHGLEMPPFTEQAHSALEQVLGDKVTVSNPLDYHTYIWGNAAAQTACFTALLRNHFDAHLLVLDFPRADRCDGSTWRTTLDAFVAAHHATGARACVVSSLPEGLPDELATTLIAQGLAPMQGTADCLRAIALAAQIGQVHTLADRLQPLPKIVPMQDALSGPVRMLDEYQSKQALQAYGVPLPPGGLCHSADNAVALATRIGFPVVVKAVSDTLAHKTEAGAVRLNLPDAAAVGSAVHAMQSLASTFLVEKMAQGTLAEVIVGIHRDPQFGLALTVGAGGILVELLKDSVQLLLPLQRAEVLAALQSLRMWPLLQGYRGKPAGDLDALVDTILAIARFAEAHAESLQELDVNPVLVLPLGQGVLAVDALIRTHAA